MHRTILNLARCMVFGAGLPLSFWGDAGEYGMYVLNWSSSRANEDQKSSLKVLTGQASNLRHIVVFGSKCAVFRYPGKRAMNKRACEGVIVGRINRTKGTRCTVGEQGDRYGPCAKNLRFGGETGREDTNSSNAYDVSTTGSTPCTSQISSTTPQVTPLC
ncbi:hypothetical protein PC116_g17218 [Phytophthora cactorum]|nr:hypothetical protein Pcac1_g12715 [Phytophthora cactorum]KAG4234609.1 hypothetical protein PC116_g17218 [Phytophthora cactorum]